MPEINANFIVQPLNITIESDNPGITVTPTATNLNVYTGILGATGATGPIGPEGATGPGGGPTGATGATGVPFLRIDDESITVANGVTTINFLGNGVQAVDIGSNTVQVFISGEAAQIFNGNSNVVVAANGNVTVSVAGNANVLTITGTGANVNGTVNASGNLNAANANFNGTLTATGNLSAANANLGNLAIANFLQGTLITNAQPNITSVGTLSSLQVTGNANVGGILTDNYYYSNGTPVDFQQPGGGNRYVQFNDDGNLGGDLSFQWNKTTNVLYAEYTQTACLQVYSSFINLCANSTATGTNAVAIGQSAQALGAYSIALGTEVTANGTNSIKIGRFAGANCPNQGIAIGSNSGQGNAGATFSGTIAIGQLSGYKQTNYAIAIGHQAAGNANSNAQGDYAIAIGVGAGGRDQQADAIAIGTAAGSNNQGINSIAIGRSAGVNNQANNSIVINASNTTIDGNTANALFIKPIRNSLNDQTLVYDTSTGEISYTNYIKTVSTVVGSLTAAATVGAGTRAFVTDANTTTFLAIVGGGGANSVPVVSDGTNWLVG